MPAYSDVHTILRKMVSNEVDSETGGVCIYPRIIRNWDILKKLAKFVSEVWNLWVPGITWGQEVGKRQGRGRAWVVVDRQGVDVVHKTDYAAFRSELAASGELTGVVTGGA